MFVLWCRNMTTVGEDQNRFRGHGLDINDGGAVNLASSGSYTKYGYAYALRSGGSANSGLFASTIRARNTNCSGELTYSYASSPYDTATVVTAGSDVALGSLECRDSSTFSIEGGLIYGSVTLYDAGVLSLSGSLFTLDGASVTPSLNVHTDHPIVPARRYEASYQPKGATALDTFSLVVYAPFSGSVAYILDP